MNIALKISSSLSILLAIFLFYNLIDELGDRMSIFEIAFIPFIILIIVIINAILSFLLLIGKLASKKIVLIVQIIILIPISVLLYQILYNSTISCT
ncbi:hypothetical protein CHRY9293_02709 [Chryseobacterium potabilaquae]|uniref:Uncharacterized protein n=1 Tax=Chryseobacterium potabilaquae TaxID=2675057 RepID=A0A6N4X6Q2_9FLAO|nr:hypothetical protein CHRY9293_02709 [Chryseobacterium potabilaquae]